MKTSIFLFVALSIAGGLLAVGCAKKAPEPAAAGPAAAGPATSASLPIYKNDKGEMICPVSGDVVKSIDKAAGFQDYKGKRYYFCCPMCPPKFKADPDKFVVRHETEPM